MARSTVSTNVGDGSAKGIVGYGEKVRTLRAGHPAIQGIRTYAERLSAIRRTSDLSGRNLRNYAQVAGPLIREDARRRFVAVTKAQPTALLAADFVPSLVDLADIELTEETRHSLLLAALVDPQRSGPVAEKFWDRLVDLMKRRVTGPIKSEILGALEHWSPEVLPYLQVDPHTHGSEWHNLDVFARVERDDRYQFGLVIENKVRAGTAEQDKQLLRYWSLIRDTWHDGLERTVFLFLTEGPREMTSAGDSAPWWIHVYWDEVAALLWNIAADESLPLAHRVVVAQYRELVMRYILGAPTLTEERRAFQRLKLTLSDSPPEDEVWVALHGEITALWRGLRRS